MIQPPRPSFSHPPWLLGFVLAAILWLPGCMPPLERQGVPLGVGIRLDEPVDTLRLAREWTELRKLGFAEALLELPLHAHHASQLPQWDSLALVQAGSLLDFFHNRQIPVTLASVYLNYERLFPANAQPAPTEWFAAYQSLWDSLHAQLAGRQPNRIILGTEFRRVEHRPELWRQLLDSLRQQFSAPLGYAASLTQAPYLKLWAHTDFLAITHKRPSPHTAKPFVRTWHPRVDSVAQLFGLPVVVSQANLLGAEKALQLKNTLRFWSDSTQFGPVYCNTLYGFTPLQDSVSRFGWTHQQDFLDYLADYPRPSATMAD